MPLVVDRGHTALCALSHLHLLLPVIPVASTYIGSMTDSGLGSRVRAVRIL